jgi:hypothetical protein
MSSVLVQLDGEVEQFCGHWMLFCARDVEEPRMKQSKTTIDRKTRTDCLNGFLLVSFNFI